MKLTEDFERGDRVTWLLTSEEVERFGIGLSVKRGVFGSIKSLRGYIIASEKNSLVRLYIKDGDLKGKEFAVNPKNLAKLESIKRDSGLYLESRALPISENDQTQWVVPDPREYPCICWVISEAAKSNNPFLSLERGARKAFAAITLLGSTEDREDIKQLNDFADFAQAVSDGCEDLNPLDALSEIDEELAEGFEPRGDSVFTKSWILSGGIPPKKIVRSKNW